VQHGKCSHAQATATGDLAASALAVSETRKLAAILVADIVGYSRLAGADEDRILARLRTLRSDLIDPILAVPWFPEEIAKAALKATYEALSGRHEGVLLAGGNGQTS
jgi:hypothetical protein